MYIKNSKENIVIIYIQSLCWKFIILCYVPCFVFSFFMLFEIHEFDISIIICALLNNLLQY